MAADRTQLWLTLLSRLTETYPRWAVWKNVESAFAGTGDIDSFAPPGDWPSIQETFRDWATKHDLGPMIVCRHIPQGPHFVALEEGSPYIVQLDVKERGTFRGSTLIDAWSLLPRSEMDERGFRRVRPGVEGVIKLCMNGTRKGGRPNVEGLRSKRVAELLSTDPEGVESGALLLGAAAGALRDGAAAVVAGGWDRPAMSKVEAWSLLRGAVELRTAVSRFWFINVSAKRCPVVKLIRESERRVPSDRQGWLEIVAADHEIYPTGNSAG